jgi:hypothetical protein
MSTELCYRGHTFELRRAPVAGMWQWRERGGPWYAAATERAAWIAIGAYTAAQERGIVIDFEEVAP